MLSKVVMEKGCCYWPLPVIRSTWRCVASHVWLGVWSPLVGRPMVSIAVALCLGANAHRGQKEMDTGSVGGSYLGACVVWADCAV